MRSNPQNVAPDCIMCMTCLFGMQGVLPRPFKRLNRVVNSSGCVLEQDTFSTCALILKIIATVLISLLSQQWRIADK